MSKHHASRHLKSYRQHAAKAAERERLDSRPFPKGYNDALGHRCGATTIREPDDPRWDPDVPDTYVSATCNQNQNHRGWHVSPDGYAWDPDDDTNYVALPCTG
jgi:hypothetical protein